VPFEPGSPTSRARPKNSAKSAATVTAGTTPGTQRQPTSCVDVTSELALATGAADVKAAIWTPPMGVTSPPESQAGAAGRASWRPMSASDQLPPVKPSPPALSTLPGAAGTEPQRPPLPPPPALMSSLRAGSLYVCAVCGFDAGGYVQLAQHMMTSHYSVMTSSAAERHAAATPFKRRWHGDSSEPVTVAARWTPPPSSLPLSSTACRPAVSHPDDRRQFLHGGFQASSTPMFHRQASPAAVAWASYRSVPPPPPPMSTAFDSLRALRAELDTMRFAGTPSRPRADERTYDHNDVQRDSRVRSAQSDVVDAAPPQWTTAAPQDFPHYVNSQLRWNKTRTSQVEHLSAAPKPTVSSGLPLDLSTTKLSTAPRHEQSLDSVQSEVKRSRRKGKAFKVDADRLNSGSRDDELADVDPVARCSTTEMNSAWRISENLDEMTSGEQARSIRVLAGGRGVKLTSDRDPILPAVPRYEEPRRSGCSDTTGQRTPTTSVAGSASSPPSTQYHECRHCGLGFRDGELFAMHMDFHGRPDPFTCNFCGAATGNQVEFFLHVAHAPHNVRPVYVV